MRKLVVGVVALFIWVPYAVAGPSASIEVNVAKKKGDWIESGFVRKNVGEEYKNLFWRVQNQENSKQEISMTSIEAPAPEDYRVRWYRGKREITSDVRGPGYEFHLPSQAGNGTRIFKARLKAKVPNPDPLCVTPVFDVAGDSSYSFGVYINSSGVCG